MDEHIKIRVKFTKTGALRYIGHLDTMRFFQKCNRRAGMDVCYSGGFSPHQIMSFASPLSVGLESIGEYFDLEVQSLPFDTAETVRRYNEASVPQIKILSVKRLPQDAGNAMASVAAASYEVRFREGRMPRIFTLPKLDVEGAIHDYLSAQDIPFRKEGKSGERFVNLRPGILSLTWDSSDACCHMLLDASSSGNVKPIQVMETFLSGLQEPLLENALLITRIDLMTHGSQGDTLISLDDVGETF